MPLKKIKEVLNLVKDPVSLNATIGNDEDDTILEEIVADETIKQPDEIIASNSVQEAVNLVLNTLEPREKEIIKLRYGIGIPNPQTLEEVGKQFNLTKERIRQIEAKALNKLRNPARTRQLASCLD